MSRWPCPTPERQFPVRHADEPGVQPIRVVTLLVFLAIAVPAASQQPFLGALVLGPMAVAVIAVAYGHATGERPVHLVLTPAGFRVTREWGLVRRTRCEVAYRWDAVSATRFGVSHPGHDSVATRHAWLAVVVGGTAVRGELVAGGEEVLQLDTRFVGIDDLLAIVNAMTPHLPYRWERGRYDRGGVCTDYQRVARAEAPTVGTTA